MTDEKKSFFKRMYASPNWRIFSISVSVMIFIFIFMACIIYELKSNRQDIIDAYSGNQAEYLALLAQDIQDVYESGGDADDMRALLRERAVSSGERFVVLEINGEILWAQNDSTTSGLGSYSESGEFWEMINEQDVVVDKEEFACGDASATVSMVTDRNSILETATIRQHDYYIVLATGFVSVVLVSLLITLLGFWNKTEKNLDGTMHELHIRNRKLEEITWADGGMETVGNANAEHIDAKRADTGHASAPADSSYRFKFYMDARHSIYINGHMGEIHPHTWEMIIQVVKNRNNFVRFDMVEKAVEKLIEPYQNSYLNESKPFDAMNPTVENICRYFSDRIRAALSDMGWSLIMIEVSETPGRAYVLALDESI